MNSSLPLLILSLLATTLAAAAELTISLRAEPKTFNPIFAIDNPSREIIRLLFSDLVHIDREQLTTQPALAEKWRVSSDAKSIDLTLRRDLKFSDGQPVTISDVLFSFQLYLDPALGSPQRDLLIIGGTPLRLTQTGPWSLRLQFEHPYAPAERIFDSLFIVPKNKLQAAHEAGQLRQVWTLANWSGLAGTGPFRLVEYRPGDRAILERNPFYWRRSASGAPLPHLDRLTVRFIADPEVEALQFRSGALDLLSRVPAQTFETLREQLTGKGYDFLDAGPGLEYHFLFFNLNTSGKLANDLQRRQQWYKQEKFRQAVSLALDRQSAAKLVYSGRATPIWQPVSPGNRKWFDASLPRPARSLQQARALLAQSGFTWNQQDHLLDSAGMPVTFSIALNAANAQHQRLASLFEQDLRGIGIRVQVVPLEFRSLIERVLSSRDYDAAIMALVPGDADPGPEMTVWLKDGKSHIWNLNPSTVSAEEQAIDEAMRAQMVSSDPSRRRAIYAKVQALAQSSLPLICLLSPNILTAHKAGLRNVSRGILPPYSLSRLDEIEWAPSAGPLR
jgi:peptide/nickel transport system substrate-binding protein